MLEEARRLQNGASGADEAAFALRETERRYLPDTLAAYLDIPASQRDEAAAEMVVSQLSLLERATAQRLAALAEASRTSLAANGAFLSERFGTPDTLPAVSEAVGTSVGEAPPPQALVVRFFAQLGETAGAEPAALVALAAERFATLLPALTTVKRGLFGGPPRAVTIDVPSGGAVLRYGLESVRSGVETSCTKVVRGIALRSERCEVGAWLQALFEDVGAYVERDRATRDLLTRFFRS